MSTTNKKDIVYGNRDILDPDEFEAKNLKERITIFLDQDILEYFKSRAQSEGTKYQTLINAELRSFLGKLSLEDRIEKLESQVFKKKTA